MVKTYNDDFRNILPKVIEENKDRCIIVVSDPPFNVGYHYNSYKDKLKEDDYLCLMKNAFSSIPSVVIHYPETLYKIAFEINKVPSRVVSWVYNSNTAKQHRDIAFFDIKPDFNKVRQPYKNLNDKRIQKRIEMGKTGAKLYDWWNINQVKNVSKEKTSHPCQMPIEVMKNIIGILPEDALIIDTFMGSGTTGVACIELNRDFIGMEIDKEYFEIANKRLKDKEEEIKSTKCKNELW
jgi:DNA modification methylase